MVILLLMHRWRIRELKKQLSFSLSLSLKLRGEEIEEGGKEGRQAGRATHTA